MGEEPQWINGAQASGFQTRPALPDKGINDHDTRHRGLGHGWMVHRKAPSRGFLQIINKTNHHLRGNAKNFWQELHLQDLLSQNLLSLIPYPKKWDAGSPGGAGQHFLIPSGTNS